MRTRVPTHRRWLGALLTFVAVATVLVGFEGTAQAYTTPQLDPTLYMFWTNSASNMCLSAPADAGAPIVEVSCTVNLDQEWFISQVVVRDHRTGSCMCTRTYDIFHSIPSQLCMTMSDPSGANGSPVVQQPCQISNSLQYWLPVVSDANVNPPANRSAPFMFVNGFAGGKCLDVENGLAIEQLPMQVWDCNHSTRNQAWVGL